MSNAFTNFLSNTGGTYFKSYSHATGLYVDNTYARAPKLGFLYFVSFDINPNALVDTGWKTQGGFEDVGLLVQKIDMPKFKIKTEVLNQYNRKTQVPTVLTYDPVNIVFHDDNSEITNGLWKNYYKYYFADSNYGDQHGGMKSFDDTKYGRDDYSYGLDSYQSDPFFNSISIYVLHQQQFTQILLSNPKITGWDHDTLDQDSGTSILKNKMSLVYEDVTYYQGDIIQGDEPFGFAARYYDNVPGPLSVGGNPANSKTSNTGQLPNREMVFGARPGPTPPPTKSSQAPIIFPEKNYRYGVGRPSVSQLQKAQTQQSFLKLTVTGLGGIQLAGGTTVGGAKLGFNIFSGRSGVHSVGTVTAGPVNLIVKK